MQEWVTLMIIGDHIGASIPTSKHTKKAPLPANNVQFDGCSCSENGGDALYCKGSLGLKQD